MTTTEQQEHFKEFTDKMEEVLLKKGNDYANDDRLSNFKLAGTICGGTPELNCLNLIATKVARLGVLLQPGGGQPNNESIRDSILDLANYAVLLDMIITEKHSKHTSGSMTEKEMNAWKEATLIPDTKEFNDAITEPLTEDELKRAFS